MQNIGRSPGLPIVSNSSPPTGSIIAVSWSGGPGLFRHKSSASHVGYGLALGPAPGECDSQTLRLLWEGRVARFETETKIWSFHRVTDTPHTSATGVQDV